VEKDKLEASNTVLSSEKTNACDNLKRCSETAEIDVEVGCRHDFSDCDTVNSRESCWIRVDITGEPRYVEGNCSICLLQFEEGDVFVSSTRKTCNHGFHQDCALAWLASGKKRCPLCRNFFVPGSRVDNKEIIMHREGDTEAYIPDTIMMCNIEDKRNDSITEIDKDEEVIEDVVYHNIIATSTLTQSESNAKSATIKNASDTNIFASSESIDTSVVKAVDEVIKHCDVSEDFVTEIGSNNNRLQRERSGRRKTFCQVHPLSG
jgi:hypothetical protein